MKHLLAILLFVVPWVWGDGTLWGQSPPCVAIDKNKLSNPLVDALFLWGKPSKFWPQHATLRVKFLDGSRSQRDRAWTRFAKVDALVNLTFVRVASGDSDIRVSFVRDGHWSYLGRDCATIPQREPTMSLSLSQWDGAQEWDRVSIHEVLHAIGFGHELQHPHAEIPWNVPAVLAYYQRTQGWSEAQIRRQVLNRESAGDFNGSAFDPDSIMAYPVPRDHVTDARFAIGWNRRLSLQDLATLTRVYPPRGPPTSTP